MRPRLPRLAIAPVLAGLVLAGLVLAGCAGGPQTAAPPQPEPQAPPAGAPAVAVAAPEEPESAPEKPLPALDVLFGAAPAQLIALMGEPALKRVDPPAELWQYKAKTCVLALYLYADGKAAKAVGIPVGTMAKVTHAEARDLDAKRIETGPCFHTVLREKGKP